MQKKNHPGKIVSMKKIIPRLKKALKGRVCIVGIGNILCGDDAFGPIMIQRLKGKVGAELLDAGTAPENFLGPITKMDPETIIILDTADLGVAAGNIDILNKGDILKVGFSTHDASPSMFMSYLEGASHADIFMIAVQPKNIEFGRGLTREMEEAIKKIEDIFCHCEEA